MLQSWVLTLSPSVEEEGKTETGEEVGCKGITLIARSQNAAEELTKLGGARVILGTVPSGKAMSAILGGLAVNGKLIVIGASDEPIEAPFKSAPNGTPIIGRLAQRNVHRFAGHALI